MSKIKIPLIDLAAQYRSISGEVKSRVTAVIESQRFILGPEVDELEQRIAEYSGVPHAVGVASGTDALILSLKALGVGEGHEVITTPFTFYATASSAVHAGARPVFVDIDPETCLIRPELIEAAVTDRTKAIIPVHLFGQCADMDAIARIADKRGLAVLEDACQAIGAGLHGKKAGSMGDAAALSFYPSKNLGAYGDGGMVLTVKDEVADKLRMLRVHGASKLYHHRMIGYNSRLDSIQAAVLLAKLPLLDEWAEARAAHAAIYDRLFAGTNVRPLRTLEGAHHVYNNYVIRVPRRDDLLVRLSEKGIGAAVYYPVALHKLECFSPYVPADLSMPGAERAASECVAIPVYPEMTEAMVEEVAGVVLDFVGRT